jgi:transglutaminase/protease-like cytokinesis protein 3
MFVPGSGTWLLRTGEYISSAAQRFGVSGFGGDSAQSEKWTRQLVAADTQIAGEWGETGIDGLKVYQYGKTLLGSNEERAIYDLIASSVRSSASSVEIKTSLEPAVMKKIYKYYTYDHVENFNLGNSDMVFSYRDFGTKRVYDSYTIRFAYKYDKTKTAQMRTEIASAAAKLMARAAGAKSEQALELALHDALVDVVGYENRAIEDPKDYPDSFTVYGALVKGSAVCDGYAKSLKLLLDSAGIKSLYVSGQAVNIEGAGAHAWNIVQIGGKWYYVDATFDDPVFVSSRGQYIKKNVIDHSFYNYTADDYHVPGVFNSADPFASGSENYETMPQIG